ncbi:glycosyltransferase family 2 protein [Butyrivibrio sp. VCB2006]|uniref:glycosyltransferase family 2 protein n=1 Tax=Butyrivibrio sp. VCB2006 TaxID=1280679 RepID=UPI0004050A59|nr:glycosyltransferase family 2 protein [Butyrivibrio sp. VCB2006]
MLITVIVPIYNASTYLEECLESIVNQDYKDLEIILVNDGSTDGSLAICEKYALGDERIKVINQENKGLVRSRKVGISSASGEYISFVDADDYIDQNMYSELAKYVSWRDCETKGDWSNDLDIANAPEIISFGHVEEYADHSVTRTDGFDPGRYDKARITSEVIPQMLSKGGFFSFGMLPNIWCKLIKRSFLEPCDLQVSDIVRIGEDADMFFQLLPQANSLQIVDFCPYHYRKLDSSMMQTETNLEAIEALYKDLYSSFTRLNILDVMEKQFAEYMAFIRLLKAPETVEEVESVFGTGKRIALYGAGGFGKALYSRFKDSITLWVDAAYDRYSASGLEVCPVDKLVECQDEYDLVYIAILKTDICKSVMEDLRGRGVSKIIRYYGLDL